MVDPKGLSPADGYGNGTGVDFINAIFPNADKSGIDMNQCESQKCVRTFTYRPPILCDEDGTCPKERFGPPKTYDIDCLLTFGLIGKGGGAVVGNVAAGQAPKLASALGAGAKTMGVVTAGVELFTGPFGIAFGAGSGLYLIAEKCECKK